MMKELNGRKVYCSYIENEGIKIFAVKDLENGKMYQLYNNIFRN